MKEYLREYGGVLPCGGKGLRLTTLAKDTPKSLFQVGGKELIRHTVDVLDPEVIKRLVFAVDHKKEKIEAWVRSMKLPHVIHFSEQTGPGVLGAIVAGAKHVDEDCMVACNTDEIRLGLNLAEILNFHESHSTLATMVVAYANKLSRHRVVNIRESDNIVIRTRLKSEEYINRPDEFGLVNTGFLIIEKEAMKHFDSGHSKDWAGIIDPLCEAGQLSAYVDGRIHYFNVGTPEEYEEARNYLEQYS